MFLKGFTLIEMVISVFVVSVAVVGIFSAFSVMTIMTSDMADRLTATYLAQEGMEIVRNIRDTNWLNMDTCSGSPQGSSCPYGWSDGFNCGQGCQVDYTTTGSGFNPVMPFPYTGDYLNIDAAGFYSHKNGTSTKFKRKIVIEPIEDVDGSSDHIIKVVSQVSWDRKATIIDSGSFADNCGAYNCIAAEATLYNWYNYANY